MATNKNITMKQFNGADYDTLFPATIMEQLSGVLPLTKGGTGVNSLNSLVELLSSQGVAKIETGSYVGTGVAGAAYPNSLTFSFVPKFLLIVPIDDSGHKVVQRYYSLFLENAVLNYNALIEMYQNTLVTGGTPDFIVSGVNTSGIALANYSLSNNMKTITWFAGSPSNPSTQLNNSSYKYYYLAIG